MGVLRQINMVTNLCMPVQNQTTVVVQVRKTAPAPPLHDSDAACARSLTWGASPWRITA